MQSLRSDTDANTLYMTFSGEVTVADLSRLERTAVVAARVLDDGFALVTDISDCTGVTGSAVERIGDVTDQLGQFGLASERRLVSDSTPESVRAQFATVGDGRDVDVLASEDEPTQTETEKASG